MVTQQAENQGNSRTGGAYRLPPDAPRYQTIWKEPEKHDAATARIPGTSFSLLFEHQPEMTVGKASLVLVGVVAAATVTMLVLHSGRLGSRSPEPSVVLPPSSNSVVSSAAVPPADPTVPHQPERETQEDAGAREPLSDRKGLEKIRKELEELKQMLPPGPGVLDKRIDEVHTRQLLEAGFTQERIDWMRQQSAEINQARERANAQNRQLGIRDPFYLAYKADESLGLRTVLSEEEFVRYRQAIRQPTDVLVTKVYDAHAAQAAGIVPGDHLIRYDGRRVFNYHELNALSETTTNANVVVEVLRDGQSLTFVLPRGEIGLRGPIVGGAPIRP